MQAKRLRKEERARIRGERAELRHNSLMEAAASATKPVVEGYAFRYEPRIECKSYDVIELTTAFFNEAFLLASVTLLLSAMLVVANRDQFAHRLVSPLFNRNSQT